MKQAIDLDLYVSTAQALDFLKENGLPLVKRNTLMRRCERKLFANEDDILQVGRMWFIKKTALIEFAKNSRSRKKEENVKRTKELVNKGLTLTEISEKLGVKYSVARNYVAELRKRGELPKIDRKAARLKIIAEITQRLEAGDKPQVIIADLGYSNLVYQLVKKI